MGYPIPSGFGFEAARTLQQAPPRPGEGFPPITQVGALRRATASMAPGARVCLTVYLHRRHGVAPHSL